MKNNLDYLCLQCILPTCRETSPRCLIQIAHKDGVTQAVAVAKAGDASVSAPVLIEQAIEPKQKNPDAVALGRLGGLKGGPARAAKYAKKKVVAKLRLVKTRHKLHGRSLTGRFPLCGVQSPQRLGGFKFADNSNDISCQLCLKQYRRWHGAFSLRGNEGVSFENDKDTTKR